MSDCTPESDAPACAASGTPVFAMDERERLAAVLRLRATDPVFESMVDAVMDATGFPSSAWFRMVERLSEHESTGARRALAALGLLSRANDPQGAPSSARRAQYLVAGAAVVLACRHGESGPLDLGSRDELRAACRDLLLAVADVPALARYEVAVAFARDVARGAGLHDPVCAIQDARAGRHVPRGPKQPQRWTGRMITMKEAAGILDHPYPGQPNHDALRHKLVRAKPGDPFYELRPDGPARFSNGKLRADAVRYVAETLKAAETDALHDLKARCAEVAKTKAPCADPVVSQHVGLNRLARSVARVSPSASKRGQVRTSADSV